MTELPKNGWYVELPKNKDEIDLDKLSKVFNGKFQFYRKSWLNRNKYYYVNSMGYPWFTDELSIVANYENVTHLFLKQPEYTIDNLPEKWFVEMSEDVDRELLCEKLGKDTISKDYFEYYGKNNKQEDWGYLHDDDISAFYGYVNVTHLFEKQEQPIKPNSKTLSEAVLALTNRQKETLLEKIQWFEENESVIDYFFVNKDCNILNGGITGSFHQLECCKLENNVECGRIERDELLGLLKKESKKQEQSMQFNEVKEEIFINTETIEIDGKKYRKIYTDGKFENGDLVLYPDNKIGVVIGYDDNRLVFKVDGRYIDCGIALFKLEEIKTKTWHYAIYKGSYGNLCHSDFYETKEELEDFFPNLLEYRTFTEEI